MDPEFIPGTPVMHGSASCQDRPGISELHHWCGVTKGVLYQGVSFLRHVLIGKTLHLSELCSPVIAPLKAFLIVQELTEQST